MVEWCFTGDTSVRDLEHSQSVRRKKYSSSQEYLLHCCTKADFWELFSSIWCDARIASSKSFVVRHQTYMNVSSFFWRYYINWKIDDCGNVKAVLKRRSVMNVFSHGLRKTSLLPRKLMRTPLLRAVQPHWCSTILINVLVNWWHDRQIEVQSICWYMNCSWNIFVTGEGLFDLLAKKE